MEEENNANLDEGDTIGADTYDEMTSCEKFIPLATWVISAYSYL